MAEAYSATQAPNIEELLDSLQGEPQSAIIERERATFDRMSAPFSSSIVLFGAGALGRFTLEGLRRAGVQPLAFSDNNSALWGKRVDGLEVLSPSEAVTRYGDRACFVVTIYHGAAARGQLREWSCQRVAPVAPLFWKYPEIFIPSSYLELPHRIVDQADDIRRAYSVLADDFSRREFCAQLKWRVSLDYGALPPHHDSTLTYFPSDLVRPIDGEIFVDCGAFDGDSIRSFLSHRNNTFQEIYALEPDPKNQASLIAWIESLPSHLKNRITVLPYAVGSTNGEVSFNATSTVASRIEPKGGSSQVETRCLDDLFAEVHPTYIKMDIEGAEPEAIRGATRILASGSAVLAACLYHRSEHLWQIPLLIHSVSAQHKIYVRRYAEECWEIVCYAVPPSRLRAMGPT